MINIFIIGEHFMKPENAAIKMMQHNTDEKSQKLKIKQIILGIVICLLCIVLPMCLLWLHQTMKVTSGVGKF